MIATAVILKKERLRLIACMLLVFTAIPGCTSLTLPLCPRLAELSYIESKGERPVINRYIDQAVKSRGIAITQIGPFQAEYRGTYEATSWLKENYPALLCAFEPTRVIDPKATHISCINNAKNWMEIVGANKLENLFLDETLYKANCYSRTGD